MPFTMIAITRPASNMHLAKAHRMTTLQNEAAAAIPGPQHEINIRPRIAKFSREEDKALGEHDTQQ